MNGILLQQNVDAVCRTVPLFWLPGGPPPSSTPEQYPSTLGGWLARYAPGLFLFPIGDNPKKNGRAGGAPPTRPPTDRPQRHGGPRGSIEQNKAHHQPRRRGGGLSGTYRTCTAPPWMRWRSDARLIEEGSRATHYHGQSSKRGIAFFMFLDYNERSEMPCDVAPSRAAARPARSASMNATSHT
jgi:hypothetical protein